MRNNIAFDLDGTLVDLLSVMADKLRLLYGAEIVNHTKHRLETDPPLSRNKIWKAIEAAYPEIDQITVFDGVFKLMRGIYFRTLQPIKIITARPFRSANDTYALCERIMPVPFELILCGGMSYKGRYLYGCKYYVEDRRKVAHNLAERWGKIVYLVNRPYNQPENGEDPEGVRRIKELTELIDNVPQFVRRGN